METNQDTVIYVGFWRRFWAALLDVLLAPFFIVPFLYAIHGRDYFMTDVPLRGYVDFLNSFVLPSVLILAFWFFWSATPGLMLVSGKIVDAKTGKKPSPRQLVIRYLGYYVSTLFLGLGHFWIAFDARKQGWHDKLAGTVVIRRPRA